MGGISFTFKMAIPTRRDAPDPGPADAPSFSFSLGPLPAWCGFPRSHWTTGEWRLRGEEQG